VVDRQKVEELQWFSVVGVYQQFQSVLSKLRTTAAIQVATEATQEGCHRQLTAAIQELKDNLQKDYSSKVRSDHQNHKKRVFEKNKTRKFLDNGQTVSRIVNEISK
jgi:hypothetical protein